MRDGSFLGLLLLIALLGFGGSRATASESPEPHRELTGLAVASKVVDDIANWIKHGQCPESKTGTFPKRCFGTEMRLSRNA